MPSLAHVTVVCEAKQHSACVVFSSACRCSCHATSYLSGQDDKAKLHRIGFELWHVRRFLERGDFELLASRLLATAAISYITPRELTGAVEGMRDTWNSNDLFSSLRVVTTSGDVAQQTSYEHPVGSFVSKHHSYPKKINLIISRYPDNSLALALRTPEGLLERLSINMGEEEKPAANHFFVGNYAQHEGIADALVLAHVATLEEPVLMGHGFGYYMRFTFDAEALVAPLTHSS